MAVKKRITEGDWLTCDDPVAMLKAARARMRHRKLRLFACACCRHIWDLLPDKRSRQAIDTAERYAEGKGGNRELRAAAKTADAAHGDAFDRLGKGGACLEWAAAYVANLVAFKAAESASWMSAHARRMVCGPPFPPAPYPFEAGGVTHTPYSVQADLVRDIFGNPFRPAASLDATYQTWQGGLIVRLARAAYEDRSLPSGSLVNDRLQDLADALEEAGCLDADLLGHLRGPGPHVRGCWPLDLLLTKE